MIETNIENLNNELLDIVKLFYPDNFEKIDIRHIYSDGEDINFFCILGKEYYKKYNFAEYYAKYNISRVLKYAIKADLFEILSKTSGKDILWGCLTGIRPVRLYKDIFLQMKEETNRIFKDFFRISDEKLELLQKIVKNQQIVPPFLKNDCDIYIGIPFCKGKCHYCSFVSADINKSENLVAPFIDALLLEIAAIKELVKEKGLNVRSLYIGGGTPSSLPHAFLKSVLKALDWLDCREYTFEAGRPDTVDYELLSLLKEYNVNRISINPQTSNDGTLKLIGRNHTYPDIIKAYELSKKFNFDVNMDLIAGLANEDLAIFKKSLNDIIDLNPENITIHTLALKRGSGLKIDIEKKKRNGIAVESIVKSGEVAKMLDYAKSELLKKGFEPYYLYKQKYAADNLENTGYCRDEKVCIYNVDNMDDNCTVLACGANAISKRVFQNNGRIERYANPKDIKTYIEKIDIIIKEKKKLYDII